MAKRLNSHHDIDSARQRLKIVGFQLELSRDWFLDEHDKHKKKYVIWHPGSQVMQRYFFANRLQDLVDHALEF